METINRPRHPIKLQSLIALFLAILLVQVPWTVQAASLPITSISAKQVSELHAYAYFSSSELVVGQTVTVTLAIQNIPEMGITGADFECQVNQAILSYQSSEEVGLFGPDPAVVVTDPNKDTQHFAISRSGENLAKQEGAVFQITYMAVEAGQTELTCTVSVTGSDNSMLDIPFYGASLQIELETPSPEVTPDPSPGQSDQEQVAVISGAVIAGKPVTVCILDSDGEIVSSTKLDGIGSFSIAVPIGSYILQAQADGYLTAEKQLIIQSIDNVEIPTLWLPAGDINGDNNIDEIDVVYLANEYGKSENVVEDLNGDGKVNLIDLVLLGINYRKTGPISW